MTAPLPWVLALADHSVVIIDANGAPVGMFPADGRVNAQAVIEAVNTGVVVELRAELAAAKGLILILQGDLTALDKKLERVRQMVLATWDEAFYCGNAGRGWSSIEPWHLSDSKVRLENEGLSTEMPK